MSRSFAERSSFLSLLLASPSASLFVFLFRIFTLQIAGPLPFINFVARPIASREEDHLGITDREERSDNFTSE